MPRPTKLRLASTKIASAATSVARASRTGSVFGSSSVSDDPGSARPDRDGRQVVVGAKLAEERRPCDACGGRREEDAEDQDEAERRTAPNAATSTSPTRITGSAIVSVGDPHQHLARPSRVRSAAAKPQVTPTTIATAVARNGERSSDVRPP